MCNCTYFFTLCSWIYIWFICIVFGIICNIILLFYILFEQILFTACPKKECLFFNMNMRQTNSVIKKILAGNWWLPVDVKGSNSFKRCLDMAERGAINDIKANFPGYFIRYKSTLEALLKHSVEQLSGSCGIWISGTPRCGKNFRFFIYKSY